LILNTAGDLTQSIDLDAMASIEARQNLMKYSVIIVACLPVMLLYPFVQRYFVKGVMIGAVKG
ncbi:MAG: carbohydrate ABC transporter permease, partial [Clostridia bacterium]